MATSRKLPVGVLLAGGLARRMGGDKPMQRIGDRTLLERAVARLMPQCDELIVNANGDTARFASLHIPVVLDNVEGFPGPLAGVLAALDWTAEHRPHAEWVLSAPVDAPFLPRDLVARLQQAQLGRNAQITVAASAGQTHPVVGLWNVALRSDLRHALIIEDIRRVNQFIARHKSAVAEWPIEPFDPFFNVNTPEDVETARRIAPLDETHG